MIAFACSHCGAKMSVKDELTGRKGKCPKCAQPIVVPSAVSVPAAAAPVAPPLPVPAAAPPGPENSQDDSCAETNDDQARKAEKEAIKFLSPAKSPGELGRLGPYRVIKLLGAGGMGFVFQALDPNLGRLIALKVMRPSLAKDKQGRRRFLREAQATAAIEHDHIVAIYQVGKDRGVPYITMPFLKGETLDDRLKREGMLPIAEVVRIGREIAEGLAAAHEHGLVHRDIKPANVWLESQSDRSLLGQSSVGERLTGMSRGRVKILDFGLARTTKEDVALTRSGAIMGTPAYMSPEQAKSLKIDHHCDLFSLGAVLYRAAAGELPFQGVNAMAMLLALTTEEARPLRQLNPLVPAALEGLVHQLLAKSAKDRPATAAAVADALAMIERQPLPAALATQVVAAPVAKVAVPAAPAADDRTLAYEGPSLTAKPICREVLAVAGTVVASVFLALGTIGVSAWQMIARLWGKAPPAQPPSRRLRLAAGLAMVFLSFALLGIGQKWKQWKRPAGKTVSPPMAVADDDAPPLPDKPRPFALLRNGKIVSELTGLAGAIGEMQKGDVIEVWGNGPFAVGTVNPKTLDLTVRAAPGYRPVFVPHPSVGNDWFNLQGTAFTVQGCDFRAVGKRLFLGGGGPWEIRNCRLAIRAAPGNLLEFSGPKLRIADCDFLCENGLRIAPNAELELRNNLCRGWGGLNLAHPGGQKLGLYDNTFADGPNINFEGDEKGFKPVEIRAEGNLIAVAGANPWDRFLHGEIGSLKKRARWFGKENFFVRGDGKLLGHTNDVITFLTAWNQYWGRPDEDSELVQAVHYQFEEPLLAEAPKGIELFRKRLEKLRKKYDPKLGPDMDLVGPGDAYVRALKAAGKKFKLRPEPPPEGRFVLLRGEKLLRGYGSLPDAVNAAESGDVVEIRADDVIGRFEIPQSQTKRLFTLRAGPSYRPTIDGDLRVAEGNQVAIEGIRFRNGRIRHADGKPPGQLTRVAYCSFEGKFPDTISNYRIGLPFATETNRAAEIEGCFLPDGALEPGGANVKESTGFLTCKNSVLGSFNAWNVPEQQEIRLECDGCLFLGMPSTGWSNMGFHGKGTASVLARRTVFDAWSYLEGQDDGLPFTWRGNRNLFLIGHRFWCWNRKPVAGIGLAEWQKHWKSDKNSAAGPATYDSPRQWRLLPSFAGYKKRPGGKDFGCDVDKVAVTAPPVPFAVR